MEALTDYDSYFLTSILSTGGVTALKLKAWNVSVKFLIKSILYVNVCHYFNIFFYLLK